MEPRKVQRECPVCGIAYQADRIRLKHGRQTTCSRSCSYKHRAAMLRQQVALVCSTCGDEFSRSPAQVKSKHEGVYCSRTCHYRGRGLGLTQRVVTAPYVRVAPGNPEAALRAWVTRRKLGKDHHSQATRERLREATASAIAEGRISVVSKLEDEVAELLPSRAHRQVGIRGSKGRWVAVVDFMLDGWAIEVNGTFWHTDPRVFPLGPVHPIQRRNAAAWLRKCDALARRRIPLRVIWESDFREDPREAVRVALAGIA